MERRNVRPIFIGDDKTHENAFSALKEWGVGILVGRQSESTAARYLLRDPAEVERFLQLLIAHCLT